MRKLFSARQARAVNQLKLAIGPLLDLQVIIVSRALNNFSLNASTTKQKGFLLCLCSRSSSNTEEGKNIEHVERNINLRFFACSVCTFFSPISSFFSRYSSCRYESRLHVLLFLSPVSALLQAFSFNGKVKGTERSKNFKVPKKIQK